MECRIITLGIPKDLREAGADIQLSRQTAGSGTDFIAAVYCLASIRATWRCVLDPEGHFVRRNKGRIDGRSAGAGDLTRPVAGFGKYGTVILSRAICRLPTMRIPERRRTRLDSKYGDPGVVVPASRAARFDDEFLY